MIFLLVFGALQLDHPGLSCRSFSQFLHLIFGPFGDRARFAFDDELIDGDLFNPNGEVLTVPQNRRIGL